MIKPRVLKSGVGFEHKENGEVEIYKWVGVGKNGSVETITIPKGNILSTYIYLGRVLRSKK